MQSNNLRKLASVFKDSMIKEDKLDYSLLLKHLLNQELNFAANKFAQSIIDRKASFLTSFKLQNEKTREKIASVTSDIMKFFANKFADTKADSKELLKFVVTSRKFLRFVLPEAPLEKLLTLARKAFKSNPIANCLKKAVKNLGRILALNSTS